MKKIILFIFLLFIGFNSVFATDGFITLTGANFITLTGANHVIVDGLTLSGVDLNLDLNGFLQKGSGSYGQEFFKESTNLGDLLSDLRLYSMWILISILTVSLVILFNYYLGKR